MGAGRRRTRLGCGDVSQHTGSGGTAWPLHSPLTDRRLLALGHQVIPTGLSEGALGCPPRTRPLNPWRNREDDSPSPSSPRGLLRVGSGGPRAPTAWSWAAYRHAERSLCARRPWRCPAPGAEAGGSDCLGGAGDLRQPSPSAAVGTVRQTLGPPGGKARLDVFAPDALFSADRAPSRAHSARFPSSLPGYWNSLPQQQRVGKALRTRVITQLPPGTSHASPAPGSPASVSWLSRGLPALRSCGG